MMSSMIVNAVLSLGVLVMVGSSLLWAIRTSHRDVPAESAKARLGAGAAPVRTSRHPAPQPHFGAIEQAQA